MELAAMLQRAMASGVSWQLSFVRHCAYLLQTFIMGDLEPPFCFLDAHSSDDFDEDSGRSGAVLPIDVVGVVDKAPSSDDEDMEPNPEEATAIKAAIHAWELEEDIEKMSIQARRAVKRRRTAAPIQPLVDPIAEPKPHLAYTRSRAYILVNHVRRGRFNFATHWDPPRVMCQCLYHEPPKSCSIYLDIAQVNAGCQWIADAEHYRNAEHHMSNRPEAGEHRTV